MVMLSRKAIIAAEIPAWTPSLETTDGTALPHTWFYAGQDEQYNTTSKLTSTNNDNDPVGVATNQGSSSYDILQATDGARPTLKINILNGKPVWRLDGGDLLKGAFGGGATTQPYTIFLVTKIAPEAVDDGQNRKIIAGDDTSNRVELYQQSRTPDEYGIYAGATMYGTGGTDSDWHIWTVVVQEASSQLWIDGTSQKVGNSGNKILDGLTIGALSNGSGYWIGDFAEVLIYTSRLSNTDKNQINQYLKSKYSLPYITMSTFSPWATPAVAALTTPTYDGSGEATHPDVYDAGEGNTWNSYRYWMAMTPYPAGQAVYENPSILASNDGDTWVVPDGLTNPLDPAPTPNWNSDTDLIMANDTLYCFYRQSGSGLDVIKLRTSTDGINWSNEQDVFSTVSDACLSPAIVEYGGMYIMFSVNGSVGRVFERRTASDLAGPWGDPETITLPENNDLLWHLNVTVDSSRLWIIWNRTGYNPFRISYSDDGGLTWNTVGDVAMTSLSGSWDTGLYRATLVRKSNGFDMWYGGHTGGVPDEWRIGRTTLYGLI